MSMQEEYKKLIEEHILDFLPDIDHKSITLYESMKYSLTAGGKRIRPILLLAAAEFTGCKIEAAIPYACALEYIHTYSLIHDDMPCMDDDDLRRGMPTNHKVYGEAFALLAGDGLLTAAFERITDLHKSGLYSADVAVNAIYTLSHLAGSRGMIGGQVIDLINEDNADADIDSLMLMDNFKTGALIEAACVMGCIVAEADEDKKKAAAEFAKKIGLAFQIKDDILDVTGTLEKLGKMAGSDMQNGKSTYVTLIGVEKCQELVDKLTEEAMSALDAFDDNEALKEYAEYLSKRDY